MSDDKSEKLRRRVFRDRQVILSGPGRWDFAKGVVDGAVLEFQTGNSNLKDVEPLFARIVLAIDLVVRSGISSKVYAFVAAVSLERAALERYNIFTRRRSRDLLLRSWIYGVYSVVYREHFRGRYYGVCTMDEGMEKLVEGLKRGTLCI